MRKNLKRVAATAMATTMAFSLTACSNGGDSNQGETKPSTTNSGDTTVGDNGGDKSDVSTVPTIDEINVGEDYKELEASIKVLTNRTDIVDTVYKGYAEEFMKLYPNIKVEYEGITDYEESLNLRLTTGDWGDLCFIPTSVDQSELSTYFTALGSYEKLDEVYNFCSEKAFEGTVYGIANGGTASGVVYNKRIWKEAGITEIPKTPDDFLDALQKMKDNTDAIPLYTNFAAGWTMGAWDAYIGIAATGNPDFMSRDMVHTKDPFAKKDDMTGPYAVFYTCYESIARKLVEEDPASSDWEASKGMMNNGEIATMVLGSWAVQQCKDAGDNPDDVGYMPFPISVDGKQYAGAGGNYAFGVNNKATTENQIAAMLYMKWLIEDSTIYEDEGSIPALKDGAMPATLADFEGVELLSDTPAIEGEETLFNDVNNESEVGINNDDYPNCYLAECAMYGSKTLDEVIAEWNQQWSDAQQSLGVEVNK